MYKPPILEIRDYPPPINGWKYHPENDSLDMNKTVEPEAPEIVPYVQVYSDSQQGGSNITRVGLVGQVGESGL